MARKAIFPLLFKPGVNRDLTPFETETCTDAQWMRWYSGRARAMGGQLGARTISTGATPVLPQSIVSDFLAIPQGINSITNTLYIAVNNNGAPGIDTDLILTFVLTDNNWVMQEVTEGAARQLPGAVNRRYMGTFVTDINNNNIPVFLGTNTRNDLFDNSAPMLWRGNTDISNPANTTWTLIDNAAAGISTFSNGGLCWVDRYLFLYGSNGTVQYSAINDPFNFIAPQAPPTFTAYLNARRLLDPNIPVLINGNLPADATDAQIAAYNAAKTTYDNETSAYDNAKATQGGLLTIAAGEKVLFGSSVRGGANSPSILFWTTKKVVLVSNVGTDTVNFRIEALSKSSSVLSSRCIIEYDGLFFWPGTNRFYVYNGIVGEMVNDMNRRFFFANIDMNRRQEVFGIYNQEFSEMWWFYWDRQGNQRAIIYNKNINSWYDTAIRRDAGKYYNDKGYFITFGKCIVQAQAPAPQPDNYNYLWLHTEDNIQFDQTYWPQIALDQPTDVSSSTAIPWYLVTPNISAASATLNPAAGGTDSMVIIESFEPDIQVNSVQTYKGIPAPMQIKTYLAPYAQSPSQDGFVSAFFGRDNTGQGTEKIDVQSQQTNITFRFSGITKVQFGKSLLVLTMGDKNRSTLLAR